MRSSATVFVGAVGDDDESKKLVDLLRQDGTIVKCQHVTKSPTGRCAVLINGTSRTLVTQLGASVHFNFEKFMNDDFSYVVENARVIYISVSATHIYAKVNIFMKTLINMDLSKRVTSYESASGR